MDYLTVNKAAWDKRTKIHVGSKFYDIEGFLKGKSSLQEIELCGLNVKGKSLLHLQCHFGLDTLSWAREGADVTGIDLSSAAIEQAQDLAKQIEAEAKFICTDLYNTPERVSRQFDIVFTSYGAIAWLPDLDRWAKVVSDCLKAGGQFYMVEFHPLEALLDGYSYFAQQEPDVDEEGTYTENCDGEINTVMSWPHPISEVLNALMKAGLELKAYNEFDFSPYDAFAGLQEESITNSAGELSTRYFLEHKQQRAPLTYSVSAIKSG
ncbi:class I SAM-dependent methyltransferase [Shewanella canadensis]|uniref:Class I SAM-dependent methyltransferase n=1 Tax=Shewanella canadensis TaxID=271096 RepID=A0A431WPF6_9GAMM|nr:class I SAM-dependent methyltransferase [Shewanella canadensis]RTR37376.1 class I SAM-dependent methyltransferase [Shewanella canadensis]